VKRNVNINMKRFFIILLLLLFTTPLLAHTLYMKDGRVIKGRIVAQTRTEVKINVNGTVLTFQKSDIRQVEFDTPPQKPQQPIKKPEKKPEPAKKPDSEMPINRWTLAGRSALIPGWGHWKAEEKWTGAGYFFLTAGLTAYAIQKRSAAISAKANYESQTIVNFAVIGSTNPLGDPTGNLLFSALLGANNFNGYQSKVNAYNQSLQLLAVAYTGQIVHAWFTGRRLEKTEGALLMPMSDETGRPTLGVYYYMRF